jgi:hypothetical protein
LVHSSFHANRQTLSPERERFLFAPSLMSVELDFEP